MNDETGYVNHGLHVYRTMGPYLVERLCIAESVAAAHVIRDALLASCRLTVRAPTDPERAE
jgi:hypothetical protein